MVERGIVTSDQVEEALSARGETYARLGEVMVAKGWLTEEALLDCLAEQYHLPIVDLERTRPDPACIEHIGLGYCLARLILPLYSKGERLVCAVTDPLDNALFQALEDAKGFKVDVLLASPSAIRAAIQRLVQPNDQPESGPVRVEDGASPDRQSP